MAFQGYGSLKTLVVDDFNNFRLTVIKMLEEFGCRGVASATAGNAAIKLCQESAYDLILCDYNLGQGKNGQQVLEELRHRGLLKKTCLFVMLSAESSVSIVLSAFDYAPDAYLTKPITGNTLKKRLDRLLAQRQAMYPVLDEIDRGDLNAAIAEARQAIDAGSRYTMMYQKLLAELLMQQGDPAAAEQVYRQVLEVRPLDWAQVGMAQVKLAQKDAATAIEWSENIVKENPHCMAAYDVLADAYARNKDDDARQKALAAAVAISPRSILRQSNLARVAESNNDFATAAKAYSRAVRLGVHSCHDKPEHHLQLGRASVQLYKDHDPHASEISREALRVLDAAGKRFALDKQMRLQAQMVECQLLTKRGENLQAGNLFDEIQEQMTSLEAEVNIDSELELVHTYEALGKKKEAEQLTDDLLEKYRNDQSSLEKLDSLLEEPVSDLNRKKVARLNKQGIDLYRHHDYKSAIECFVRARRLFPNHIGVHLNLVQVLVADMKEYGVSDEHMEECLTLLRRVQDTINNNHAQFTRFRQLQDMVRNLGREAERGLR